ncbi:MAG: dihydroorotate dehydrogenase electron transfer subunit [bacterium]
MKDITCKIIHHAPLKAGYWTLTLDAKEIASVAQPGQFVHIRIPSLENTALRRPFSIFGATAGKLKLLYKTVGRGTEKLTALKAGETLSVLGPLGKGFPLTLKGVPLLVGGGFGVAPLCFLAEKLPRTGTVFIGGRTADDILASELLQLMGWTVYVTTQDGSQGETGLVTLPLDREINQLKLKKLAFDLFACGPDGMLKAVGQRAIEHNMKGWLSLDKHMVCGVGACLACIQKLRKEDGTEWTGRVCRDGPVFESREIVW